eukprot:1330478-Pleurochrysis_carterae.AAC.1
MTAFGARGLRARVHLCVSRGKFVTMPVPDAARDAEGVETVQLGTNAATALNTSGKSNVGIIFCPMSFRSLCWKLSS